MTKKQFEINRSLQDELFASLMSKVSTDVDTMPWNSMFLESYTTEDEDGKKHYEYRLKESYTQQDIDYAQDLVNRIISAGVKEIWK